jgi:hypothetical protein
MGPARRRVHALPSIMPRMPLPWQFPRARYAARPGSESDSAWEPTSFIGLVDSRVARQDGVPTPNTHVVRGPPRRRQSTTHTAIVVHQLIGVDHLDAASWAAPPPGRRPACHGRQQLPGEAAFLPASAQ